MDRNPVRVDAAGVAGLSLSARRAWIEMCVSLDVAMVPAVALRKESVDRNNHHLAVDLVESSSLSARRAWIEILMRSATTCGPMSLSARRAWIEMALYWFSIADR